MALVLPLLVLLFLTDLVGGILWLASVDYLITESTPPPESREYTVAVINGLFNMVGIILTAYLIQITHGLDKEVNRGGK